MGAVDAYNSDAIRKKEAATQQAQEFMVSCFFSTRYNAWLTDTSD